MYSLGEVEAVSKKAAKATGFSWGESSEVATAIRNLVKFNLPHVEAFIPLFYGMKEGNLKRPLNPRELYSGNSLTSIGFFLGLHILDSEKFSATNQDPVKIELRNITLPLTLLGVLLILTNNNVKLTICWDDFHFFASPEIFTRKGNNNNPKVVDELSIDFSLCDTSQTLKLSKRADVKQKYWDILESLALSTYVPDSEVSNKTGAGSGNLIDD